MSEKDELAQTLADCRYTKIGECPSNSCPWDNGQDGPTNPYEQKEGNK